MNYREKPTATIQVVYTSVEAQLHLVRWKSEVCLVPFVYSATEVQHATKSISGVNDL